MNGQMNIDELKQQLLTSLEQKGLTLVALAHQLGVSPSLLAYIKNGRRKMTADLITRVMVNFPDLIPLCLSILTSMYTKNHNAQKE